jgi:valyl-tRNA synthetase
MDPLTDTPPGYHADQRDKPHGFTGEKDVQDTWATSSLTPQISGQTLPLDIRPQAHEIIRTWAFYTIAKSWLHEKKIPWKNVVISGWVLDPQRQKMSKSKGNTVTPLHLLETYSADGLRYWAARARPGVDTAFDETVFKVGKRLVTKLYNAGKFVYERLRDVPEEKITATAITAELDRGFALRLKETVASATKSFESFDWAEALQTTESFFWADFCDDYLELVKTRAYGQGVPEEAGLSEARLSALAGLRLGYSVLLRLFAPFLPYITEEMWSRYFAGKGGFPASIHISPWPKDAEMAPIKLPESAHSYNATRSILTQVRRQKGEAKVSVRTPAENIVVSAPEDITQALQLTLDDLRAAAVIQKIYFNLASDGPTVTQIHLQTPTGLNSGENFYQGKDRA